MFSHLRNWIIVVVTVTMALVATMVVAIASPALAQEDPVNDGNDCALGTVVLPDGSVDCLERRLDADAHLVSEVGDVTSMALQGSEPSQIEIVWAAPSGVTIPNDITSGIETQVGEVQDFVRKDVDRALRFRPGVARRTVSGQDFEGVASSLVGQGFDDPNTIYLVFADITPTNGSCGTGGSVITTARNAIVSFAMVWMPSCNLYPSTNDFDFFGTAYVMLHEVLHTFGAVPECAPNFDGTGHVDDVPGDVLYRGDYPNGIDDLVLTIDAGRNDYFGHGRSDCIDIADHPAWASRAECPTGLWCAAAQETDPVLDREVSLAQSCLAGNGRVDFNIVNSEGDARYRIEFEGLSAREYTVRGTQAWRMPFTGRRDGSYDVTVTKTLVGSNTTRRATRSFAIDCDEAAPTQLSEEVDVISYCSGGQGFIRYQFVNPTRADRTYVIGVEGLARNRSTTARPFGASISGVSGRPNGTYTTTVEYGDRRGDPVHTETIRISC